MGRRVLTLCNMIGRHNCTVRRRQIDMGFEQSLCGHLFLAQSMKLELMALGGELCGQRESTQATHFRLRVRSMGPSSSVCQDRCARCSQGLEGALVLAYHYQKSNGWYTRKRAPTSPPWLLIDDRQSTRSRHSAHAVELSHELKCKYTD